MCQQQSCSKLRDSTAYTLLADTERLILAYSAPINESALQVYHSAVATMPSCLLWAMLGQYCVGIPLLVSQRTSGWGPRVKITYDNADAAVFSPDSRFIISCYLTAQLWDVATGTQVYSTSDASGDCTAVAFSPDGQSVLCGFEDGTVEVRTIATWAKQAALPGCSNTSVAAVTFTPDSQSVVSAFEDGTVGVWTLTQWTREVSTIGCGISRYHAVAFSLDCQFMVAARCEDNTARVWKLISGAPPEPLVIAGLTNGTYNAAAFSPDGCTVVFGSQDHGIHVWDTATGTQRSIINGHSDWVTAVAFSRDGQFLVSGSADNTIMVWNFSTGAQQPDYVLKGHSDIVKSVAFSPDTKLVVSTSDDGTMRVWSGAVSVDESVMEGNTGAVPTVAFSHDGRYIASGSEDSTIRVWDAAIGRQKYVLEGHKGFISRVVFSPDSQIIASCSWDKTVRLWDVATGTQVHAVLHHPWWPHDIVFSHDGQSILAINDYTRGVMRGVLEAYVWEVATGTQKCVISYSSSQLYRRDRNPVVFSPSDQLLVATLHSETDSDEEFTSSSSGKSDEESTSSRSGGSDEESTSSRSGGSDEESTSTRSGGSDKEAIDHKVWDASTGVELAVQDLAPALARDMDGALLSRDERSVAPYHTLMSDGWILVSQDEDRYHWHRVCWLPAERQPMISGSPSLLYAYHDQKVCIGAGSGAVTILDLSNVPMAWAR
jgi:WD40 repeat protein